MRRLGFPISHRLCSPGEGVPTLSLSSILVPAGVSLTVEPERTAQPFSIAQASSISAAGPLSPNALEDSPLPSGEESHGIRAGNLKVGRLLVMPENCQEQNDRKRNTEQPQECASTESHCSLPLSFGLLTHCRGGVFQPNRGGGGEIAPADEPSPNTARMLAPTFLMRTSEPKLLTNSLQTDFKERAAIGAAPEFT